MEFFIWKGNKKYTDDTLVYWFIAVVVILVGSIVVKNVIGMIG